MFRFLFCSEMVLTRFNRRCYRRSSANLGVLASDFCSLLWLTFLTFFVNIFVPFWSKKKRSYFFWLTYFFAHFLRQSLDDLQSCRWWRSGAMHRPPHRGSRELGTFAEEQRLSFERLRPAPKDIATVFVDESLVKVVLQNFAHFFDVTKIANNWRFFGFHTTSFHPTLPCGTPPTWSKSVDPESESEASSWILDWFLHLLISKSFNF